MIEKCQKVNHNKRLNLETNRQLTISQSRHDLNCRYETKIFLHKAIKMKGIKHFILTIIINAVLLYVIANHVPELWFKVTAVYKDTLVIFGALGLTFRVFNSLLRNILKALTLPIKYITLGLSWLVINVLLLYIFEQSLNYADIGIIVTLGTLTQTFILSLVVTFVHLAVKKLI